MTSHMTAQACTSQTTLQSANERFINLLCVVGTDTDIGKTYISGFLAKALRDPSFSILRTMDKEQLQLILDLVKGTGSNLSSPEFWSQVELRSEAQQKREIFAHQNSSRDESLVTHKVSLAEGSTTTHQTSFIEDNPVTVRTPLHIGYFKAAISGSEDLEHSDAGFVKRTANLTQSLETMTPYHFKEPLSPHFAAERVNQVISFDAIIEGLHKVCRSSEAVIFEGTGGLYCPFGKAEHGWFTFMDLIRHPSISNMGIVLVGPSGLGAINQICCSYQCLLSNHFAASSIMIVMNNFDPESSLHQNNLKMVKEMMPCCHVMTVNQHQDAAEAFLQVENSVALLKLLHGSV